MTEENYNSQPIIINDRELERLITQFGARIT